MYYIHKKSEHFCDVYKKIGFLYFKIDWDQDICFVETHLFFADEYAEFSEHPPPNNIPSIILLFLLGLAVGIIIHLITK